MKLLTHNMLTSNIIKGVTKGFPLGIHARKIEKKEVDYNPEFVTRMIPKLDWSAFRQAAGQVECEEGLPEELAQNYGEDEQLLKKIHHILLEVEVIEGDLVCPESGRKFPVTNGIPNMMLKEDEA